MEMYIRGLRQRVPVSAYINLVSPDTICDPHSQATMLLELNQIAITNPYYVKLFLKQYIAKLEKYNAEVEEGIYELYCNPDILYAHELPPTEPDIIAYKISELLSLKVKEHNKLISGMGTTGLRTWEAAVFMASKLANCAKYQAELHSKTICELGAGTGLVSLAIMKSQEHLRAQRLIVTDGEALLPDKLNDSFTLNGIDRYQEAKHDIDSKDLQISCQQLLWGTTNEKRGPDSYTRPVPENVDLLLGADITYDSRLHQPLCSTISDFFATGTKFALIAATIRKEETAEHWESEMEHWFPGNWAAEEVCHKPEMLQEYAWYRPGTPEIRIYRIHN